MACKLIIFKPLYYHVWRAMFEDYHKRYPKPKTIAQLRETLQMIWDSFHQGPNDNVATDFPGKLMLKLTVDTLNICSDCRILRPFAVVWMTLIYCEFVRTFSNALKSIDGKVTVLIILRTFQTMKCCYGMYYRVRWTCVTENYPDYCPNISLHLYQFWSTYLNICMNYITFTSKTP